MESNNIDPCFARLPLGDRKNYEEPTIWVDKLPQISIICAGSDSANTGSGEANEDHINWEEGNGNSSIWEEEEE